MTAKKEGVEPALFTFRGNGAKKGQVTLFIILGIALILGILIIVLISQEEQELDFEESLEQVPSEIKPIQEYTLSCIQQVAEDGLKKIGEQGGFIKTDEFSQNPSDPTAGGYNSILFSSDGDLVIPYWRFLASENKCDQKNSWCLFSSNRPLPGLKQSSIGDNSIESQLTRYIQDNIDTCLNDFIPFAQQGYTIDPDAEPKAIVRVNQRDITVHVEYPLTAKRENVEYTLSRFYLNIPLNFKEIYELADEITKAEENYTFIEKHTLNMITAFADVDSEKLPPKTELKFKPGEYTTWSKTDVEENLKDMLMSYTPAMQVYGTRNFQRNLFSDDIQQALYDQMTVPLNLDGKYQNYNVQFLYFKWWPIYLNINQGEQLIKPDSAFNPLLPSFGIQRYSNTYDISYPVIVRITDPDAFSEEGYSFIFALEANIRNNKPMKSADDFENLQGYSAIDSSLFCNPKQRTGKENIFIIKDASDNQPIKDINLVFSCGDESCYLGATDYNGTINSSMPVCINGIASFSHMDYFIPAKIVTTNIKDKQTHRIDAYPYTQKEISIKMLEYSDDIDDIIGERSMNEKHKALVKFTRNSEGLEEEVNVVLELDKDNLTKTARLVPGKYDVSIDVFLDERIEVNDQICYNTGFLGLGGEKCEDFNVEFNSTYPLAGVRISDENRPFSITASDLYSSKNIELYAIAPPIPRNIDDLENVGQFNELSTRFREALEPQFIN